MTYANAFTFATAAATEATEARINAEVQIGEAIRNTQSITSLVVKFQEAVLTEKVMKRNLAIMNESRSASYLVSNIINTPVIEQKTMELVTILLADVNL